jgi:hypothetical protein
MHVCSLQPEHDFGLPPVLHLIYYYRRDFVYHRLIHTRDFGFCARLHRPAHPMIAAIPNHPGIAQEHLRKTPDSKQRIEKVSEKLLCVSQKHSSKNVAYRTYLPFLWHIHSLYYIVVYLSISNLKNLKKNLVF